MENSEIRLIKELRRENALIKAEKKNIVQELRILYSALSDDMQQISSEDIKKELESLIITYAE